MLMAKAAIPTSLRNKRASCDRLFRWSSFYQPTLDAAKPSFCIQLPPPNVTGTLHMGHAFNHTLMDILTRWHRMRGFDVLWQPGQDHAGIATQMVVERRMAERMGPRKTIELDASHASLASHPSEIADLIDEAVADIGAFFPRLATAIAAE